MYLLYTILEFYASYPEIDYVKSVLWTSKQ